MSGFPQDPDLTGIRTRLKGARKEIVSRHLLVDLNISTPLLQELMIGHEGLMDSVLELLRHYNYADNVFLMCKFRKGNPKFETLEQAVRDICKKHQYNTLIADDPIRPDLWDNVKAHMLASSFGIAIFDKMDQQAPSVNVFIESGFMLGRGKDVLFLVEDTVPLPLDYGGKIVRRFDGSDSQTVRSNIEREVDIWLGSKRRRNYGH